MVTVILGDVVIMPLIDGNRFGFQRIEDKVKDS
jgi:hypothetical protein